MPSATLDTAAAAIASGPRRAILERLAGGPATISELAAELAVTVPGALKHVDRLAAAGIVTRSKHGRVVTVTLVPGSLDALAEWATRTRLFWANHLDRYVAHLGGSPSSPTTDSPRSTRP